MTWQENNKKGHRDKRNGILRKGSFAVKQIDSNGGLVKEYVSAAEASRQTGVDFSDIRKVCRGSRISAGGYKWVQVIEQLKQKQFAPLFQL